MFTRHVIMQLKENAASGFTGTIEAEVLPILRKQKGFRDEITFISTDGSEAIGISFWDTKEDAEAYNNTAYPQVLKALSNLVEGNPRVGTAMVSTSTLHKTAAKSA